MISQEAVALISRWFKMAEFAALVLPDGWFGRPHDNQHQLTYLAARPHKLILELDEQLMLTFTELAEARIENSELVLSGFVQCVFDWQAYASLTPHAKVYHSGEVRLVPPMGTTVT